MAKRTGSSRAGASRHLVEAGTFGDDLGELNKTPGGKLETRSIFSGYALEDVSGMFSSGKRDRITQPSREVGFLAR